MSCANSHTSLKVLLNCSNLAMGGALQVALAIIKNAAETPDTEWVLALPPQLISQLSENQPDNIKAVHTVDATINTGKWSCRSKLIEIEKSFSPDLAFTVFGPTLWRPRVPHVVGFALPHMIYPEITSRFNGGIFSRMATWLFHRLKRREFLRADCIIVETEVVRQRLNRLLNIPLERVAVVPNSYSPIFKKTIAQGDNTDKGKCKIIAIPSSYYVHKNLEIVPEVAHQLTQLDLGPVEFNFTLPEDDPGWLRIIARARELNVADSFRTLGALHHGQIADLYNQADCIFLPTLLECSTAVYPESFLARVPLITSDMDFAHDLCGSAAVYVDALDPADCARKITQLLGDPEQMDRLCHNGRQILLDNYPAPDEKWKLQLNVLRRIATKES